jgi:Flp pilus assembly CpaE family ATPase
MEFLKSLVASKRILVFLGETGSGESEAALNLALALRKVSDKPICLFDLDQTKPL